MFSNLPTNLIAFIIVLGFLVFAHESGHFLVAKLFRVRVLVFSFGFGTRLFGFKRGDTDYRVSLIPLGGYVRMAGDNPDEDLEGTPDEFLSKPKWQRVLILLAGPVVNLIIAVVFLAFFLMMGTQVLTETRPIIGSVLPDTPAAKVGLAAGDRVVAADGEPIDTWEDLQLAVGLRANTPVTLKVGRGGQTKTITVTPKRVMTDYGSSGVIGVTRWFPTDIGTVAADTAAARAGLQKGDRIVAVRGKPVEQMSDFENAIDEAKGSALPLTVERDGKQVSLTLPARTSDEENYPGFSLPTTTREYGPAEAFRQSIQQNWKMTRYIGITLGRLFRLQGSMKDFTGPVSIARISGEMLRTGINALIYLMAVISLNLGILNLLPIPVLDGGHIAILGLEGVMRRDLSPNAKERIYKIGFALLAALMIVVIYQDIIQNVALLQKG